MRSWWKNIVKDYLTFSAKERIGIAVLIILMVTFFLVPRYFPINKKQVDNKAFQKELASLKISIDSSRNYDRDNFYNDNPTDYNRPKQNFSNSISGELFVFDPNTLDNAGWKRLGLRDKTINTIQNFLAKGYKFRQPDDIRKIYGLRQQEADRLLPYVRINNSETSGNPGNNRTTVYTANSSREPYRPAVVDINTADTTALIALPGIGSKLATRIVNFRQSLGGFHSVNQVADVYGIPDSTLQRIKPRLQCNNPAVKTININSADVNTLKKHPYIKWNIANAIVNYRSQHGNYRSLNDLRKIEIISDDLFNKMAPYLVL